MEVQSLVTLEGIQEALAKTSVKELPKNIQEKCLDEILFRCSDLLLGVAFCRNYSLTPIELMQTLDAFLIETNKDTLELSSLGKFEQMIKETKHQQVREGGSSDGNHDIFLAKDYPKEHC